MKNDDDSSSLQSQGNNCKIHTFGHFQAILNSNSTTLCSDNFPSNKDEKVNISLVASCHDISMEPYQKEFYHTFLKQQQDKQRNSSNNNNGLENGLSTELHNDASSYYYLVFSSNDKNLLDQSKIIAVYQMIYHHASPDENFKCNNSVQYHHLSVEKKSRKITIQCSMFDQTHENFTKKSNTYVLQSHQAFSSGSKSIQCSHNLLMETYFEYDLFLKSLHAVLALMFMSNRVKIGKDYTQNISSCNDLNKSGIIIKVRKVDSVTNSYVILDSSIKATAHEQKPNYKKMKRAKLNTERRMKPENENQNDYSHSLKSDNMTVEHTDIDVEEIEFGDELGNAGYFYFVTPEDRTILTDFMFMLVAQVKRGTLSSKDRDNARRKNSTLTEGYLGLRCRHCGGMERGNYFPTTCKNLQACPSMIFKHLMSCDKCPQKIKQLLKIAKTKHKAQVLEKESGAQIGFYNTLWQRIHDPNFNGGSDGSKDEVLSTLKDMCYSFFNITKKKVSQTTDTSKEEHANDAEPTQVVKEQKDVNPSHPLKVASKNPSLIEIKTQCQDSTMTTTTRGKHIDRMKCVPYSENIPSLPEISIDPRTGHIKSMFDSQSLNVTLDMLDAVAGEIRNSSLYPFTPAKRKIKSVALNPIETQWDIVSFNTIKEMVESDEDYREMINFLANINVSEEIR